MRTKRRAPDIDEPVLRQDGITTLDTHDRNSRKFGFLEVRDPLDAAG